MTDVVAEIGLAHDGSLNLAHAYLDAVADAGVQWVKFQCHHPDEGTADEPWRREWSRYGETRADYWRRTAFGGTQWAGLKEHAKARGVGLACSVFCPAAVRMLSGLVDAWKIPSGQVVNRSLREAVERAPWSRPVWVSAGMSEPHDTNLWKWTPNVVLHCVSEYPTPLSRMAWDRWEAIYKLTRAGMFGLSDHSGTIWPGLQAAAEGAALVEVHVTFDNGTGLPDATSSLELDELRQLVHGIRCMHTVRESTGWERPENAHLYEPREVSPGVWKKCGSYTTIRKSTSSGHQSAS